MTLKSILNKSSTISIVNETINYYKLFFVLFQSIEEMKTTTTTTPKPTLDPTTRLELRKLCWETMFGQELVKLTIMDLASDCTVLILDPLACFMLAY